MVGEDLDMDTAFFGIFSNRRLEGCVVERLNERKNGLRCSMSSEARHAVTLANNLTYLMGLGSIRTGFEISCR